MKKTVAIISSIILFFCITVTAQHRIVVAADGSAKFKTIQGALNSLAETDDKPRTIFIKNGTYHEKIYLEKHNIILEGESRDKTIITQSISRDEWRCLHNEDWGVATMNVDGNDITLKNLTVLNNYGFENKTSKNIYCPNDTTASRTRSIRPDSHQMALRTMNANRLKAINCRFRAFAGDTVSPWNVREGLFYFKDCIMEGGVDFFCPRGWSYAENCTFITHSGEAAIWHDGSAVRDSKTVLVNCSFEGIDGFKLGRYHRDAQFYLVNCRFAANMADKDIYLVPTSNNVQWGRRVYYFNCHKKNGDYAWFADNLTSAEGNIEARNINAAWVFGDRWNPLTN